MRGHYIAFIICAIGFYLIGAKFPALAQKVGL